MYLLRLWRLIKRYGIALRASYQPFLLARKRLTGQMDGLVLCTCAKKDLKLSWRIEAELASQNTLDSFACNYSALPR